MFSSIAFGNLFGQTYTLQCYKDMPEKRTRKKETPRKMFKGKLLLPY